MYVDRSHVLLGVGRDVLGHTRFPIDTRFQRVAILRSPLRVERGLTDQFGVSEFGAVHAHGHRGSMFCLRDVLHQAT